MGLITISSISGGGKTTVSKALAEKLKNCKLLHFDEVDNLVVFPENFPNANVSEFDLTLLKNYFEKKFKPEDLVIFDFPFGRAHSDFNKKIDLALYLDLPEETALQRRAKRDKVIEKIERKHYSSVRPAYLRFIEEVRPSCELLVDASVAVDEIVNYIITHIEFTPFLSDMKSKYL